MGGKEFMKSIVRYDDTENGIICELGHTLLYLLWPEWQMLMDSFYIAYNL